MGRLVVDGLCKGWAFPVIDDLSFEVEEGEFFVIVGPSGIGKTSLLRLIAGLETPDFGRILVGGKDVTKTPPYKRRVAMTFESYALYPHMTVARNIASPLRARGMRAAEIEKRVAGVAKLLRIEHLLARKPGEVSGGQKQRTALGRTLVADPEVFLLDEPISHLDAKIRHELRAQFHMLEDLRRVATVYVTHDYAEALALGDRIGVMGNGGRLAQVAGSRELFETPANLFVAQHMGQPTINLARAALREADGALFADLEEGALSLRVAPGHAAMLREKARGGVTIGLRPQHLRPADEAPGTVSLSGSVDLFEALGSTGVMIAELDGVKLTALTRPERHFESGEPITLGLDAGALHWFDSETGANLAVA